MADNIDIINNALQNAGSDSRISEQSSPEEVKSAYRTAAKILHPDAAGKGSEKEFSKVSTAYQALKDGAAQKPSAPSPQQDGGISHAMAAMAAAYNKAPDPTKINQNVEELREREAQNIAEFKAREAAHLADMQAQRDAAAERTRAEEKTAMEELKKSNAREAAAEQIRRQSAQKSFIQSTGGAGGIGDTMASFGSLERDFMAFMGNTMSTPPPSKKPVSRARPPHKAIRPQSTGDPFALNDLARELNHGTKADYSSNLAKYKRAINQAENASPNKAARQLAEILYAKISSEGPAGDFAIQVLSRLVATKREDISTQTMEVISAADSELGGALSRRIGRHSTTRRMQQTSRNTPVGAVKRPPVGGRS